MLFRFATALLLLIGSFGNGFADGGPKAVVELFTSQGCSSCPPADQLVDDLAARSDVLPLSYHVRYWDYLGWKDTLGIDAAAERQSGYAAVQSNRRLFTPEIIVNGVRHIVGGDRGSVLKAVASARLPVPVTMHYTDRELHISVGREQRSGAKATVRLVTFLSAAEVTMQHGENRGSTIAYRNVVRTIQPIGIWDGTPISITLPADEIMAEGTDGCAVIVQEGTEEAPGEIVGAAMRVHGR